MAGPQADTLARHKSRAAPNEAEQDAAVYPTAGALALILVAVYLAVFLVALDRTILATAIPRITDEFKSLGDVGWYGSAYLLTSCAFQLSFGRIYTYYNPKIVFLVAILIFEVGSAICGAAPNSVALIIGRAIAGLGSAGIFSGAIIIIVHTIPLAKRAAYGGFIGGLFGLASVVGPVLGGAFTQKVTWRWCFYINLPIGALVAGIIILILHLPPQHSELTGEEKFFKLDPFGLLFLFPAITCLLVALQWGGTKYEWNASPMIILWNFFAVLIVAFITKQFLHPSTATIPPRIIRNRSVFAGVCFSVAVGAVLVVFVYYLPIWFQAVEGVDAVQSGIRLLPTVLALFLGSACAGWAMSDLGYYAPFMYGCAILMAVGAGLITTFNPSTSEGKWIGYQIILGFGLGLGMQPASLAAQTVLPRDDVSTGVALMLFTQSLAGAIFLSVAQAAFTGTLESRLSALAIPNLDPSNIIHIGATELRRIVDPQYLGLVLDAYNYALTKAFDVALGLACFAILGAILIEWRSTKGQEGKWAKPTSPVTPEDGIELTNKGGAEHHVGDGGY